MSQLYWPYHEPIPVQSSIAQKTRTILAQIWPKIQKGHLTYNPSPNPISLEKKHLPWLLQNAEQCVVGEKSDGVRYLLVMGMTDDQPARGFSVMVGRNMKMFEVVTCARPELFIKSCVFDGEMVIRHQKRPDTHTQSHQVEPPLQRQMFLVFDVYGLMGENVMSKPWTWRHEQITELFHLPGMDVLQIDISRWDDIVTTLVQSQSKIVCMGNHMALQYSPKSFVTLPNLATLYRSLSHMTHDTDGLVFTGDFLNDLFPNHNNAKPITLKWKAHHTIDLWVEGHYSQSAPVSTLSHSVSTSPLATNAYFVLPHTWHLQLKFQKDGQWLNSQDTIFSVDSEHQYQLYLQPNIVTEQTCRYYLDQGIHHFALIGECIVNLESTHNTLSSSSSSSSNMEHMEQKQNVLGCQVVKWRKDKTTPNDMDVVTKTLLNIQENIVVEDLIQATVGQIYPLGRDHK